MSPQLSVPSAVWSQLSVPTAVWAHSSLCPQLYALTALCSHSCMGPQLSVTSLYGLTALCPHSCKGPQLTVPSAVWAHSCLLPQLYGFPAFCSHGCMGPQLSVPSAVWFHSSLFPQFPRAHLRVVGILRYMSQINTNRACPLLFFCSVLVSVSVFIALSAVFHSINSPDNSPLSHSVLVVLFLPYWTFQLYISL